MIQRVNQMGAAQAKGILIVIDVIRVFTINRFKFAMIGRQKEWQGVRYVEAKRVDL